MVNTENDPNISKELIQDFFTEFDSLYQQIKQDLDKLNRTEPALQQELINALFRGIHTIKGNLQLVKLNETAKSIHELEENLVPIRAKQEKYTPQIGANILTTLEQTYLSAKQQLQPDNAVDSKQNFNSEIAHAAEAKILALVNEFADLLHTQPNLMSAIIELNKQVNARFEPTWLEVFNKIIKQLQTGDKN